MQRQICLVSERIVRSTQRPIVLNQVFQIFNLPSFHQKNSYTFIFICRRLGGGLRNYDKKQETYCQQTCQKFNNYFFHPQKNFYHCALLFSKWRRSSENLIRPYSLLSEILVRLMYHDEIRFILPFSFRNSNKTYEHSYLICFCKLCLYK